MARTMWCAAMLSAQLTWAQAPCRELERGFETFDVKKSAWVESSALVLLECAGVLRLDYVRGTTVLDSTTLQSPRPGEKWQLDGLTCAEKNNHGARQKVVLSASVEKPIAAWAVNARSHKLEAVDVKSLRCSTDSP